MILLIDTGPSSHPVPQLFNEAAAKNMVFEEKLNKWCVSSVKSWLVIYFCLFLLKPSKLNNQST